MKLRPTPRRDSDAAWPTDRGDRAPGGDLARRPAGAGRGRVAAFTLTEVLAALVFMAIVIPVAVEGVRVANRAGQAGQRKAVAARIADRVLNEWIVMSQYNSAAARGVVLEDTQQYRWSVRLDRWTEGDMRQATVLVTYPLQGSEGFVRLVTLLPN